MVVEGGGPTEPVGRGMEEDAGGVGVTSHVALGVESSQT